LGIKLSVNLDLGSRLTIDSTLPSPSSLSHDQLPNLTSAEMYSKFTIIFDRDINY
ncbi:MAG: hypothetical protein RLZZ135_1425, partial [Cyanobacteriota bacterium]